MQLPMKSCRRKALWSRPLAISLIVLFVCWAWSVGISHANTSESIEKRIEQVVNGLLPETHFENRYENPAKLSERMTYYHTPGVSIAVIHNGEIEWARGFGVRKWGKPEPIIPETLFQAGSISKPIFALAVLRLVQEGKLDLDEDVNKLLKSWKVPANADWQPKVTLRQLLSHSAGLTVHGFPGYLRKEPLPTIPQVLMGAAPANTPPVLVNVLPGLQFRYSGGGTTLAQQVVTDVLGQPFPQIMHALIFERLGLKHSTYEQPLLEARHAMAATAHPWKNQQVEGRWHVYPEMAAAGLWTTPSDLASIGIELQKAVGGESDRILSSEMAQMMLTPVLDARGQKIAIGFFVRGEGESVRFGHGGWDKGFVARMTLYKSHGIGAVIMINSNEGHKMIDEIERAIAREYDWPAYFEKEITPVDVPMETLSAYTGVYQPTSGEAIAISQRGGDLTMQLAEQPALELHPENETQFYSTIINVKVTFQKSSEGGVTGLTINQGGAPIVAQKIVADASSHEP